MLSLNMIMRERERAIDRLPSFLYLLLLPLVPDARLVGEDDYSTGLAYVQPIRKDMRL